MVGKKLPQPLFKVGYEPSMRRANVYGKQEYLDVIHSCLKTPEKEVIRNSQFRELFDNRLQN
ncbi:unnamed protein product [Arabis nemorensis]|uniref:Uncharacterized protein n=1 Tax=Arabis nemorensis TaxID=586526 RepID=A0A565CJ28_9BRAS|nr:unnamed protein product [Arabis nemorensis]